MFSYVIPNGALNGGDICRIMAFQIDDRFGYAGFVRVREYELFSSAEMRSFQSMRTSMSL